jgi:hypothetical protein
MKGNSDLFSVKSSRGFAPDTIASEHTSLASLTNCFLDWRDARGWKAPPFGFLPLCKLLNYTSQKRRIVPRRVWVGNAGLARENQLPFRRDQAMKLSCMYQETGLACEIHIGTCWAPEPINTLHNVGVKSMCCCLLRRGKGMVTIGAVLRNRCEQLHKGRECDPASTSPHAGMRTRGKGHTPTPCDLLL